MHIFIVMPEKYLVFRHAFNYGHHDYQAKEEKDYLDCLKASICDGTGCVGAAWDLLFY